MATPTGTEARVCADIAKRQELGIRKYGATVEGNPLSLREWLQHAYEEALDLAVYLRRSIDHMDAEAHQEPPSMSSEVAAQPVAPGDTKELRELIDKFIEKYDLTWPGFQEREILSKCLGALDELDRLRSTKAATLVVPPDGC